MGDLDTAKLVADKVAGGDGDRDGDVGGDAGGAAGGAGDDAAHRRRLWRKSAREVVERGFAVRVTEADIQVGLTT